MKYAEIRPDIKSGDLIALSHSEWDSWYDFQAQGVRVFTQSEYSHVALAWVVGGRVFVLESVVPEVRFVPLSNMTDEASFYWVSMPVPMSEAELEFALAEVHKGKYSKWQAVLAWLRRLAIGADHKWQCSEYVIKARSMSGVNLGDGATPSAVVKAAQDLGAPVYRIQF